MKSRDLKVSEAEINRLKALMCYEMALHQEGAQLIAGIDEAGRGPIAGPVVAAAVILPKDLLLPGVNDSKKVRPALRVELATQIKKLALGWAVSIVFPACLDEINIYQATRLAMKDAIQALPLRPQHLIIDAVRLPELSMPQTCLIKGDSLSISVACASILAKVERDHIMEGFEELYPGYGFGRHKGYTTREHVQALINLGPCPIHRRSFEPVKSWLGGAKDGSQGRLFE